MDCSACPHMNNLEACRNCNHNKSRRRKHTVEVVLKTHTKLKVGDVGVGKTFRRIAQMKAYQVIDLSQALTGLLDLKKVQEAGAMLCEDNGAGLVFAVELATGLVEHFPKETEVYLCPMRSIERDEE